MKDAAGRVNRAADGALDTGIRAGTAWSRHAQTQTAMNSALPPMLDPTPPHGGTPAASLGKLGLGFSLVAPAVVLLFLVMQPG
jgi:hypothetical protein